MAKVAIVVSSVGFHWEELFSAFKVFSENEVEMSFYTPTGIEAVVDPMSLKYTGIFSLFGLGVSRSIGPETVWGQKLLSELSKVSSVIELQSSEYDALYLPGGHGCLFDINRNETIHLKIKEFFDAGKVLSGVCHATSTFTFVNSEGSSIVNKKSLTGFSDFLDFVLVPLGLVAKKFLPIPIKNESLLISSGAKIGMIKKAMAILNPWHYERDLPFITGTGPKATKKVAQLVVREL